MNLVQTHGTKFGKPAVYPSLHCTEAEAEGVNKFLSFLTTNAKFAEELGAENELWALWNKIEEIELVTDSEEGK